MVEHRREKEKLCVCVQFSVCLCQWIHICVHMYVLVCVHQGVHICVIVSMCRQGVGFSCVLVCQSINQYFMLVHIEVILVKKQQQQTATYNYY